MSLLAFNLTGAPVALAAGNPIVTLPIVTLPASAVPPARGPAFNVTAELRPNLTVDPVHGVAGGLTGANYVALQVQATAGTVVFEWTSDAEYLTTGLTIAGPSPGAHAATHKTTGTDVLATASVTPTNQDTTATNGTTTTAVVSHIGAPALAAVAAVHAAFAGNDASNDFPGPFTNPDLPRNVTVTFGALWDGGNVIVTGTDAADVALVETIVAAPGTTVDGVKLFKTVASATKGAVGANAATASIGTGNKLWLGVWTSGTFGILAVDGVTEDGTWDGTYSGVVPTTVPTGAEDYVVVVNVAHTHTQATHNHLQNAHTHNIV